ncbi:hypothetical protein HDV00_011978 [Rhizophlyctis rosea]|nr:hypothetical protein HDV00_011978 [Rhizophlyctis rosea]
MSKNNQKSFLAITHDYEHVLDDTLLYCLDQIPVFELLLQRCEDKDTTGVEKLYERINHKGLENLFERLQDLDRRIRDLQQSLRGAKWAPLGRYLWKGVAIVLFTAACLALIIASLCTAVPFLLEAGTVCGYAVAALMGNVNKTAAEDAELSAKLEAMKHILGQMRPHFGSVVQGTMMLSLDLKRFLKSVEVDDGVARTEVEAVLKALKELQEIAAKLTI